MFALVFQFCVYIYICMQLRTITFKFEVSEREVEAGVNECQNIQVSANELLS